MDSVDSWLGKISKMDKFKGVAQVEYASNLSTPYYLRRPTGILSLDLAIGGGFHAGGHSEVHGPESVGKTGLAFRTAGMVQKNYGKDANILIVSTEIRTDKTYARKNGFQIAYSPEEIDHYNFIRKKRGQPKFTASEVRDLTMQTGKVITVTGSTGEKSLDVAYEALVAGLFQLVIIESLGALLSSDQEAGDVGDRTYGGSSVMLTSFMNKVYPLFIMDRIVEEGEGRSRKIVSRNMLETTVIGINQARAEIGGSPRGPKTHAAAGAYAWKHAQLVSLQLNKGEPLPGKPSPGRKVKWRVVKGKAGTHDGKTGEYNFYHIPKQDPILWSDVELLETQWGADCLTDLIATAADLGVIEKSGSWLTWKDEDGNQIARCQGANAMANELVDEDDMLNALRDQCYAVADLPVRFR